MGEGCSLKVFPKWQKWKILVFKCKACTAGPMLARTWQLHCILYLPPFFWQSKKTTAYCSFTYAFVCDEHVMGVLGVDGVAGPKAEFLLMSSALLPSSSFSSSSASMPPSHAGDMSGYWQAEERGYIGANRIEQSADIGCRILTYGCMRNILATQNNNQTKKFKPNKNYLFKN